MRRVLIDVGIGLAGMFLMLVLWHAYVDHLAIHELDTYLRTIAAPKINKLP